MTDNTNANNEAATAEGAKGPRVVKHIDVRIEEAQQAVADAQAKLDKLIAQRDNLGRYDAIAVGDEVSFDFGRGDKKRTLTGKVIGADASHLLVQIGEGMEQTTQKIARQSVLFGDEAAA